MKYPTASLLAVAALNLLPLSVTAQTTTKTITGRFKFSRHDKGSYVTTITKSDTGSIEQTVFTRKSDKATSTDTDSRTDNPDGSRTVNYTHNDFGATAQFTSTKNVTPEGHGEAYGIGSYTTADGVSGTLTALESNLGNTESVTTTHVATTGTTTELRLKDSELGFIGVKSITLKPDGTVETAVHTRYITHVSGGE